MATELVQVDAAEDDAEDHFFLGGSKDSEARVKGGTVASEP